ncbi:molecular chaperone TorD family protein [Halomonas sp. C05BenzN]|uniref:molecular chaperone TorD family protein n=1 Tax=Halomonas sp. C05BenzN TaxID=3411041 RepID=UPI003B951AC8
MTQDPQLPDLLPAAELSLCLSRVFLAPQARVTLAEAQGPLLDDLHSLAETLPTLDTERLGALARALAALTDTQQLILGYSRLFLTPPAPAPLNLGAYLDGGLMARSVPTMEALYRRHGLERDPAFRELPDHLALHLQWLAWVYSEAMEATEAGGDATPALTDAATMLHDLTLPALAGVRRKVAQSVNDATTLPWRALVELTHDQLSHDLARLQAALPALAPEANRPPPPTGGRDMVETFEASEAPSETLSCRACGEAFESDPVLAEMRRRLAAAGVSADHLAVCPRCQGRHGASPSLKPPGADLKAWQ